MKPYIFYLFSIKILPFVLKEAQTLRYLRRILRSTGCKKQESAENSAMIYAIICNTSFCDKSLVVVNGLRTFWKQRARQCTYDVTL